MYNGINDNSNAHKVRPLAEKVVQMFKASLQHSVATTTDKSTAF